MEKTWKPTTAGILTIISGALEIFLGVIAIIASRWVSLLGGVDWSDLIQQWGGAWGPGMGDIPSRITEIIGVTATAVMIGGIVILVFGIIALVGGINAIKRKRWGLALAGSILSLPITTLLGTLAIIFVSLGKKEFD